MGKNKMKSKYNNHKNKKLTTGDSIVVDLVGVSASSSISGTTRKAVSPLTYVNFPKFQEYSYLYQYFQPLALSLFGTIVQDNNGVLKPCDQHVAMGALPFDVVSDVNANTQTADFQEVMQMAHTLIATSYTHNRTGFRTIETKKLTQLSTENAISTSTAALYVYFAVPEAPGTNQTYYCRLYTKMRIRFYGYTPTNALEMARTFLINPSNHDIEIKEDEKDDSFVLVRVPKSELSQTIVATK